MKAYPLQLEISGPTALWTRPDTGSSPVSYIAPAFSAVKGIFESILRWKSVNVRPTRYGRWRLQPNAPAARSGESAEPPNGQCARHAWVDAFRRRLEAGCWFYMPFLGCCPSPALFAERVALSAVGQAGKSGVGAGRWRKDWINSTSAVPDCVGLFRDGTAPCATENHVIQDFLEMVLDEPHNPRKGSLNGR